MRSPNVKCIYPTQCAFSSHTQSGSCARRLLIHAYWNFRLYINPEKSRTQTVVFASSAHVQACHILSESMIQNIDPIGGSEKEPRCDETRRMLPVCRVHRSIVRTHRYTGRAYCHCYSISDSKVSAKSSLQHTMSVDPETRSHQNKLPPTY